MHNTLSNSFNQLYFYSQNDLFSHIESKGTVLTDKLSEVITVIELSEIDKFVISTARGSVGRPNKYRVQIARAFIAKAVLNLGTTNELIERLTLDSSLKRICGFPLNKRIPDKTVFSRAFAEFSLYGLPEKVHAALIKKHLSAIQFDTVSHDSTAIEAREKPIKIEARTASENTTKRKRGRPKKDDSPLPEKELTVIEMQQTQSFEEMFAQLPRHCNVGTKKNSKGYKETWHGYKLHLSTVKGDIPISCILTSASIHDSQVMLPLMHKTTAQIEYHYDLADAAYCSDAIRTESYLLGHKALIDHNPRRGEKVYFGPKESEIYKARSGVERVNAHLKDSHGGTNIWVKGHEKVFTHLMFGILAITVEQTIKLLV